ncbi:unnamed protein product [Heligmosomoides polygyrus]|uniref:Uncharacterized protein n=1 Tax=Heligmosomoides polygyrus TaxID=6339 RepID=A0A183FF39_HELPZ|nr:unnamed protein product [Heligmosomoides polygyrus]
MATAARDLLKEDYVERAGRIRRSGPFERSRDCPDDTEVKFLSAAIQDPRLNVKKTEYLTMDVNESSPIKVSGIQLPRTAVFKYMGSAIASDGGLVVEVNSRSKIYRAVIRPVAMYDAECWPATKEVKTRLSVMEAKILRWTAGVTTV